MRKKSIILSVFLAVFGAAFSQEFLWKAGMHGFFDNNEFSGSQLRNSQTMAGIHIAPEVGLGWNKQHRIFVGADLMHEFGSDRLIDYSDLIAYYEFDRQPFRFYIGSFARKMTLEKYPRMFFQDSILNYRPMVTGIFWEKYSDKYFLNAWLDWTGRQTKVTNEAFFVGLSGRYNLKMLYGQLFSYYYHFASKKDPEIPEGLHDNGLVWASLGIDLTEETDCFEKLEANAGWTAGVERDRSIREWHTPQGFLSEIKVEYKGLGLFNSYYRGGRQQVFYGDHSNEVYWGDPFYRSTEYNRTDLYIKFIETEVVRLKFTCSFHLVEKAVYHEQLFTATFDLDNFSMKKEKNYEYIWDNWFKR
ncbi:MAG: hypothetical protein LBR52_05300 [Prevotellaceae bacterium]|nr:hypothetical protein [Prevotellaceae bacterium]